MFPAILFVIALICSGVHLRFSKKKVSFKRAVKIFLAYIIPLNIGLTCLIGFIAHAFYGPQIAVKIGFPAHNPFQFEVAVGNLALAIAGFLCIWQRRRFWMATGFIAGVFFLGAAYGHIVQKIVHGNDSPYNTGMFLYIGDIAIPLIYLTLIVIYSRQNKLLGKSLLDQ